MIDRKKILIVLIIAIAVTVVIVVFFMFRSNLVTINVAVSPSDASVKLDGKPVSVKQFEVTKGTHTLTAEREFFGSAELEFNTNDINPQQPLLLILDANTPEALKWLEEHDEDQAPREAATSREVNDQQTDFKNANPVLYHLPRTTLEYDMRYETDDQNVITYVVTLNITAGKGTGKYNAQVKAGKEKSLEFLRSNGVNIDTAKIKWLPDFVN